jgi:hypothetical protein
LACGDGLGFGEVIQTMGPVGGVVAHHEDHTFAAFDPCEQGEMIGAEVEHGSRKREPKLPPPSAAPLRGSPAGLLRVGLSHRAAPELSHPQSTGGDWLLFRFPQAVAAEQEDFGVLHQAIGYGGSDGGIEKDVAPVGEGRVGSDDCGTALAMARGDHLVKEVGGLLVEREVA